MRPHPRRARTNPRSPRAWGTSDRNGMIGNQENLCWQFDWSGNQLINKHILVYPDELDKPQRQLGTIILPPDPVGIQNARPEQYSIDEGPPPLFTYLSADVLAGGTAVPVDSVSGFAVSNLVLVQLDNGQFPQVTVLSIDTINNILNINTPLQANASAGGTVTRQ